MKRKNRKELKETIKRYSILAVIAVMMMGGIEWVQRLTETQDWSNLTAAFWWQMAAGWLLILGGGGIALTAAFVWERDSQPKSKKPDTPPNDMAKER